ncbi:hypothetical protein EB241_17765 [Erwinia psidii]|uniref:Uncharacterized protein n=1 Tax=Erwinia psidii TaxID=69224 RepID=A0A3N6UW07_9GAMM|nr:hypothetical protein EB241_17765 [Erwinia psidii]
MVAEATLQRYKYYQPSIGSSNAKQKHQTITRKIIKGVSEKWKIYSFIFIINAQNAIKQTN